MRVLKKLFIYFFLSLSFSFISLCSSAGGSSKVNPAPDIVVQVSSNYDDKNYTVQEGSSITLTFIRELNSEDQFPTIDFSVVTSADSTATEGENADFYIKTKRISLAKSNQQPTIATVRIETYDEGETEFNEIIRLNIESKTPGTVANVGRFEFNIYDPNGDFDNDLISDDLDIDDDNDGILDVNDTVCPKSDPAGPLTVGQDPNDDFDSDGCQNDEDDDDDNDGVDDTDDALPFDPDETMDTDGDGTGDNADIDDDGDSINDVDDDNIALDLCQISNVINVMAVEGQNPTDDQDLDGCKNNEDDDDDNDTIADTIDAFDYDACASVDTDGDGDPDTIIAVGDSTTDACDTASLLTLDLDDDNDGVLDAAPDNCPLVAPADGTDLDGDGCADDYDGDSIPNATKT